jgi:hypothetical protein
MTDQSALKYDYQANSILTSEIDKYKFDYWQKNLVTYRLYLSKLFDLHMIPKNPKFHELNQDDLLPELTKLLVRVYGMKYINGALFGSDYIIFKRDNLEYVGGKLNKKNKILPIVYLSLAE